MSLQGVEALRRRFAAIRDTRMLMGQIASLGVREASALVPQKTRNLMRTIRVGQVSAERAEVIAGGRLAVGYAAVVEFGSRPHIIRARRKRALMFSTTGLGVRLTGSVRSSVRRSAAARARYGVIFRKMVHHPGTRPHPFLEPGVRRALQLVGTDVLIAQWNRAA